MGVWQVIKGWYKDLFYDATNSHLDVGRVIGAFFAFMLLGAAAWNMHLHKEISLAELGTAEAAILGALQFYIYHDRKQNASQ